MSNGAADELRWIGSVGAAVLGIFILKEVGVAPSIPILLLSLYFLPPLRARLFALTDLAVSDRVTVAITFTLIAAFFYLNGREQDLGDRAKVEAQAKADHAAHEAELRVLVFEFAKDRPTILKAANESLSAGDFESVIGLERKYHSADDQELRTLAAEAEQRLERRNEAAESDRLIAQLKTASTNDVALQAASYTRLAALHPTNEQYAERAAHFSRLLNQQKEQERTAEWVAGVFDKPEANSQTKKAGNVFVVTYDLDPFGPKKLVWQHEYFVQKLVQTGFKNIAGITRIEVVATATLVDIRGHDKREVVMRTVFSRANATTVNWENVKVENIPLIADSWWTHPALLRPD